MKHPGEVWQPVKIIMSCAVGYKMIDVGLVGFYQDCSMVNWETILRFSYSSTYPT